jgi:predicted ribosome quality control (RQC) complex YloA/Tae2 family protein
MQRVYEYSAQHVLEDPSLKEEMTSFDVAAVTLELSHLVRDAYVDNIYQIDRRTLLLKLHQPGKPRRDLLAEAGKRFHLTSYAHETPQRPSSFCMALRKHLRNGRITEIIQHKFERIVALKMSTKEGEFELVLELFGDGNIILVSPQNVVMHALTYRRMRDRNILRGEAFQHAPAIRKNPFELDRPALSEINNLGKLEIVRALTQLLSIGGLYAEEILLRSEVDKDSPCDSLAEQALERIFNQLSDILSVIRTGKLDPRVVVNVEKEWVDVTPFPLKRYTRFEQRQCKNFNEALDEYYTHALTEAKVTEVATEVDQELAKQQRIIKRQRSALEDLKTRIEPNKRIGDTIYMHLNNLQFLLQRINNEKKQGKSWDRIVADVEKDKAAGIAPATYFHSMEPKRLLIHVEVGDLIFPLNLRRSVQANATTYYTRAKKAGKKLEGAARALRKTKATIEKLGWKQAVAVKETYRPPRKRRKKAWYEKFRWFYSSDGLLVIGGRDASTNEILLKRHMEPHDFVFHADVQGAPFVLIKTTGKIPDEQTLKEAAALAASYSRAWRDMFSAVDVFWVSPEQVDKSPPSGQYLKKGSFMIHGSRNYVRSVPLKVAVGVTVKEDHMVVIGGPPPAIAKQTDICVEVVPGEMKSNELAKRIRQRLAEKASDELAAKILEIPVENIQRFIPLGRGRTA